MVAAPYPCLTTTVMLGGLGRGRGRKVMTSYKHGGQVACSRLPFGKEMLPLQFGRFAVRGTAARAIPLSRHGGRTTGDGG